MCFPLCSFAGSCNLNVEVSKASSPPKYCEGIGGYMKSKTLVATIVGTCYPKKNPRGKCGYGKPF